MLKNGTAATLVQFKILKNPHLEFCRDTSDAVIKIKKN